ncbi:hypothetical protein CDAR_100021 [Caerostris darwini]|uniref:Uncharacterized protein n=1 Tax=Caerostris darwini TaxID=1538125 RepID=A0AAV4RGC9_9ARAC|nr:hypothetical protein CDAR_100021 [Caerostris darwini]
MWDIIMSSPDSEALLRWFNNPASPFKKEFESIELLRKIEPLQFYLAKPTTHSMAKEFIQGGSGDNVEKVIELASCKWHFSHDPFIIYLSYLNHPRPTNLCPTCICFRRQLHVSAGELHFCEEDYEQRHQYLYSFRFDCGYELGLVLAATGRCARKSSSERHVAPYTVHSGRHLA